MLPSKKDLSNIEKEAVSRVANSPLKFYGPPQSESTQDGNSVDPERLEIAIQDGFDFGDTLK